MYLKVIIIIFNINKVQGTVVWEFVNKQTLTKEQIEFARLAKWRVRRSWELTQRLWMRIKVNLSSLKIFLENSGSPTIPGLLPLSKTVNCGTDFGEIMSTVFWGRCLWQIWWWWSSSLTHGLGSRGSRVQTQKNICEYLQMHVRNYIC